MYVCPSASSVLYGLCLRARCILISERGVGTDVCHCGGGCVRSLPSCSLRFRGQPWQCSALRDKDTAAAFLLAKSEAARCTAVGLRAAANINDREAHTEATGESKRIANMQLLGFFEHPLFALAASLPQGSRTPATGQQRRCRRDSTNSSHKVSGCSVLRCDNYPLTRAVKLRANSNLFPTCAVAALPLGAEQHHCATVQRTVAGNY